MDVQALENSKGAKAKGRAKHREEAVEKRHWPADLGEDEEDDLEDDEQAVDDGPEDACGLIGHRAVPVHELYLKKGRYTSGLARTRCSRS